MPNVLGLAAITLADDSAAGFSSVPTGTTQAVLAVENNAIRVGDVDFPPTATTGLPLFPGDVIHVIGNDYGGWLGNFRIINNTPGSNGVVKGYFQDGFDRA